MSDGFLIRWQGRVIGPLALEEIERRLASSQIGMLHEIQNEGAWISLRSFMELRDAQQNAQRARLEEEARKAREEGERLARQSVERIEQERLTQIKRQNETLEHLPPPHGQRTQSLPNAGSSGLHTAGVWLVVAGLALTAYFFLVFDQSVESGLGGRINNIGLMADRQNGIVVGLGFSVTGAIMLVLGNRNKT